MITYLRACRSRWANSVERRAHLPALYAQVLSQSFVFLLTLRSGSHVVGLRLLSLRNELYA